MALKFECFGTLFALERYKIVLFLTFNLNIKENDKSCY